MVKALAYRATGPRRQAGVALALVLWFLAAMSVLVGALVMQARGDVELAQHHLGKARAAAAGDGAMRLLLAERSAVPAGEAVPWQGQYQLGDLTVSVVALPVDLLVDVNRADVPLLADTLRLSAAAPDAGARALADAIVQWRAPGAAGDMVAGRFETLEDLLQVEGLNRASLDAARDFLTARREAPGVDRLTPRGRRALGLLSSLAPSARSARPQLLPALGSDALPARRGAVLRVDAMLRIGGRVWLRRCWVNGGARGPDLPWDVLRREPARVVPPAAEIRENV